MNTFEKILNILSKNLGYSIVFVVAIVFFIGFSDGLLAGIVSAFSAVVAYACGAELYRQIKKGLTGSTTVKAEEKTTAKPAAKKASKKAPAKKKTSKK